MSLAWYKESGVEESLVNAENPLISAHDTLYGEVKVYPLFLRNDSALHYYQDISIIIAIGEGEPLEEGSVSSTGILYQLIQQEQEPTLLQWSQAPFTTVTSLDDIGDSESSNTTSYIPFWLRVYMPARDSYEIIQEASLRITCIKRVVIA